jgi:hypothetical protein
VTIGRPVPWAGCDVGFPYAVLGERNWLRLTITSHVELPTAEQHSLPGAFPRAGFRGTGSPCEFSGDVFSVD